jgi:2-polyprenyl-3-methyl-5-hydroxy-6-metoxy-1,4-benzoquinol methylase
MDKTEIERRKAEIVARSGEWTAHRVHLGEGVYTRGAEGSDVQAIRRVTQLVSDNAGRPLADLRVLDLACLEGGYSIEMALRGCRVLGVEGREVNVEKARFAKEVLGLSNVEFVRDDVRNLSREGRGTFDCVLCLGILYHLDTPDAFKFLEAIAEVCEGFAVVDTLTSVYARESVEYKGRTYWGHRWQEFPDDVSEERKSGAEFAWASLDNPKSLCLTRPSLNNALLHAGFTSVYECHHPSDLTNYTDRVTLLALKGAAVELLTQPGELPVADFPEADPRRTGAPFNQPEAARRRFKLFRRSPS